MNRLFTGSILGLTVIVLTACESMTGKTAGQSLDDATVTASVQAKLTKDKLSNFSRINVDTDRNVVSLNGVVQTVEDKSRAEDLARQVTGVSDVNNNLQIQSLADAMTSESEPSQRVEGIKGEVSRIEGDTYFVRGESGKEVRLHTDDTTQKTGAIHEGDRIEAQMNEQNHALSIRSTPTTDRRNEKSDSMLTQ
jgi:hyperosmotically inducible protein